MIMTQEDKQLLIQDLCARLAFHCRVFYEYIDDLDNKTYGYSLTLNTWCIDEFYADKAVVKPYLRPLSSMTEEEKEELIKNFWGSHTAKDTFEELSWYLSKHLDVNELIPRGLAIEVTEENNPYKE